MAQQNTGDHAAIAALRVTEHRCIGMYWCTILPACVQVVLQCSKCAGGKRKPARLEELSVTYLNSSVDKIDVSKLEADDLSQTKPRAVSEDNHRVKSKGTQRSSDL